MRICDNHWAELRQAIEDRGLSKFVSADGQTAVRRIASALQGSDGKDEFDPLMQANFSIWSNALQAFGIEITANEAPCPLCALDNHARECTDKGCSRETGTDWIGFAAEEQLDNAREMGLMGKLN